MAQKNTSPSPYSAWSEFFTDANILPYAWLALLLLGIITVTVVAAILA